MTMMISGTDVESNSRKRKPRFRRVSAPSVVLTERDIGIIRAVHEHRFLTSEHIRMLFDGSSQQITRRLQLLFHNQYLDRPREQREFQVRTGVHAMVYGLGNRGADLLAERFGVPRGKVDWTSKNRETGQLHIEHTLQIADTMVRFEAACREKGNVRLVKAEEILKQAPDAVRDRGTPVRWDVTLAQQGTSKTIGVTPDNFFGLQFTDRPDVKNTLYFFLEADRGTEPVKRSNLNQSSIRRKLITYYETNKQGVHTKEFNISRFRVLFITTTRERMDNFIEANKIFHKGVGSNGFLFAAMPSLAQSESILAHQFLTGEGELICLSP
jgi:Replication-relaxation